MSLRQQQREFAANLNSETVLYPGGLSGTGKLPIENLVSVYRNNFRTSLRSALAAGYPVIRKLVGPDFFDFMADQYVQHHPLRCSVLQDFGQNLPEFLREFEPISTLPYAADVARLERAYDDVSRKSPIVAAPALFSCLESAASAAEFRFDLAPACHVVTSVYPIFSIWRANQGENPGDKTVALEEGSQSVLVVRPVRDVELWRLSSTETVFIHILARGATLGAVVEQMTAAGHVFNLETLLRKFALTGALVAAVPDANANSN